ncbi:hypothetical protein ACFVYE_35420 [Streptomyces sp. NPDC058239]|uniref:hypothetical protein n=1 Tax=Streptomyces sp. NPDC058239 TaxID=3346395 RepID=UPI0036ECFAD4
MTADRRPQTADRRPQTADRRPQTADRVGCAAGHGLTAHYQAARCHPRVLGQDISRQARPPGRILQRHPGPQRRCCGFPHGPVDQRGGLTETAQ